MKYLFQTATILLKPETEDEFWTKLKVEWYRAKKIREKGMQSV